MGSKQPGRYINGALHGAAAGAAGTTALNAVTYLDMVWRGRPPSTTPERTVERLEEITPIDIPGDEDAHQNRVSGLGPMTGILAGVTTGVALGIARAAGWRTGRVITIGLATVGAMLAGNGPMAGLGVSDPRRWTLREWTADLVPHAAYGVVTGMLLSTRR